MSNVKTEIKDHTFFRKLHILVLAFLHKFQSVWDVCEIHEGAAMSLSGQPEMCPAKALVRAGVTLLKHVNISTVGALKLLSFSVHFILKRYVRDDNVARLIAEVRSF